MNPHGCTALSICLCVRPCPRAFVYFNEKERKKWERKQLFSYRWRPSFFCCCCLFNRKYLLSWSRVCSVVPYRSHRCFSSSLIELLPWATLQSPTLAVVIKDAEIFWGHWFFRLDMSACLWIGWTARWWCGYKLLCMLASNQQQFFSVNLFSPPIPSLTIILLHVFLVLPWYGFDIFSFMQFCAQHVWTSYITAITQTLNIRSMWLWHRNKW